MIALYNGRLGPPAAMVVTRSGVGIGAIDSVKSRDVDVTGTLADVVACVVDARATGARVTQKPGGAVYVTDCAVWHDELAHLIRLAKPRAVVSILSCSSSLSGFEVGSL